MQAFVLLSFFSFFLTVHSVAIEQRSCVSPDVIAIAQQVSDPHYFCAWYLSDGRTSSPIPGINANALLNACRCVASVEPVGTHAKLLATIAEAARLHSYVSATCPSTPGNPIGQQFKNPSSFCTFFNSYERHDSPIPNLNAPAVMHACKCVLSAPKSTTKSSSVQKASSTTKHTTSKTSSTSKKSSKTSSSLLTKSSSKSSTKSSSTRASSSRSSSTKASSSRSSSTQIMSSKSSTKQPSSSKLSSSTRVTSSQTSSSKTSSFRTSSSRSASASASSSKTSLRPSKSPSSISSSAMTTRSTSVSLRDAYQIITSQHLEAFCTIYLGYTTPSITQTATMLVNTTKTNIFTSNVTSTSFASTTQTSFVETVVVTSIASVRTAKRSLETFSALASYPESAINSGCSRAVTRPATTTVSETVLVTSVDTIAATTTMTAYETDTSTFTELATSTVTSTIPVSSEAFCANGQQVNGLAGSCGSGPCVTFNLRIEGAADTIYEGPITTGPMDVTTPSGGTHLCDGTNNNANPAAAGNGISCLVSAGSLCDFSFDGTYSSPFQDLFIQTIGSSAQTSSEFWGLLNNGQFTPSGGCETEPAVGDHLLWAYNAFNVNYFLQVTPATATVSAGDTYTFTVSDASSGSLLAGAAFGGSTTNDQGQVTITFPTAGTYRYKATRSDSIRSNGVIITVV